MTRHADPDGADAADAADAASPIDHQGQISNPGKVLWTRDRITKADLADYYDSVADRLLAHLRGRPVTLNHHPRGVDQPGFMRKDVAKHAPPEVGRWTTWAPTARRDVSYALIENREALRWCAGQNVTEFHPCLFRIDRPDRLDVVVIDLDPSDGSVDAATAALWCHEILVENGVDSWVKTSGGRGLHIMIEIERRYDVDVLRRFADAVADIAVDRHRDDLTTEFHKDQRGRRLFVDCTRVNVGATLIAPWSPRARDLATVATPLEWSEVEPGLDTSRFTQATAVSRSAEPEHPPQRIDAALDALRVEAEPAGDPSATSQTRR